MVIFHSSVKLLEGSSVLTAFTGPPNTRPALGTSSAGSCCFCRKVSTMPSMTSAAACGNGCDLRLNGYIMECNQQREAHGNYIIWYIYIIYILYIYIYILYILYVYITIYITIYGIQSGWIFWPFFLLIHQAITYDMARGWFIKRQWMGQRNPNHQLIGGKHPMILLGFLPSQVQQVQVQDFAGSSTVLNREIFVGSTSPSDKVRFHIFGLANAHRTVYYVCILCMNNTRWIDPGLT